MILKFIVYNSVIFVCIFTSTYAFEVPQEHISTRFFYCTAGRNWHPRSSDGKTSWNDTKFVGFLLEDRQQDCAWSGAQNCDVLHHQQRKQSLTRVLGCSATDNMIMDQKMIARPVEWWTYREDSPFLSPPLGLPPFLSRFSCFFVFSLCVCVCSILLWGACLHTERRLESLKQFLIDAAAENESTYLSSCFYWTWESSWWRLFSANFVSWSLSHFMFWWFLSGERIYWSGIVSTFIFNW